jgi:helicase required for RNAi-mediated heterochromatin assembly 1
VKDCFATKCVVATVASRALENVEKYPPEIDIYFACPEDINIDFLQEWIMVEAKDGYFGASRHTLTALQKMVKERLAYFALFLTWNIITNLWQVSFEPVHLQLEFKCRRSGQD